MSGIIQEMNNNPTTYKTSTYKVSTNIYEGPLDLLLKLIERAELDITKLSLAHVTEQYLEHLHNIPDSLGEEVSAFLVIAAKLIQIKSEMLLPRPPERKPGEEDPGDALALQLLIYKRYKDVGYLLAQREASGLRTYLRLAPPPQIETKFDLSELTLDDLIAAARAIFAQASKMPLGTVVAPPIITIREKIQHISSFLRTYGRSSFRQLFTQDPIRLDVVVTFLALLELVKRQLVLVRQNQLFEDIEIEPNGTWDENEPFELEFGE